MASTNMARTTAQGQKQQEENIPFLSSFSPAIFAPAQIDFTAPPPALLSDQNIRRTDALAQIDEHANFIEGNIRYMMKRECKRIRQDCRQREAQVQRRRKRRPGLEKSEEKWLPVNGMELDDIFFTRQYCAMPLKGPYEVPILTTQNDLLLKNVQGLEKMPRKYAETLVLNLVKVGLQQLEGHAAHVKRVKQERYRQLTNMNSTTTSDTGGVHPSDRMDIG
ncbi:hypothetical protein F4779DRAFT_60210 [Xylariaceae sp. FL0662B]|nr:hypothetical protein F4779DRAFT_60210 [Xylariaceae sp. FL0662B]